LPTVVNVHVVTTLGGRTVSRTHLDHRIHNQNQRGPNPPPEPANPVLGEDLARHVERAGFDLLGGGLARVRRLVDGDGFGALDGLDGPDWVGGEGCDGAWA
jgi:hypothetical protein